ncbi:hypothetical protein JCM11641_003392 [Rhodosporidiobolus odoratus]
MDDEAVPALLERRSSTTEPTATDEEFRRLLHLITSTPEPELAESSTAPLLSPVVQPSLAPDPPYSMSSSSSAPFTIWERAFTDIGPLTSSTWPRWADILPKAVSALAKVPGAIFYLDGTIPYPVYNAANIVGTLNDATKRATYNDWVKLTENLVIIVDAYGGTDAKARVEGYETRFGDAARLWKELKKWFGRTGTGTERIVHVAEIMNSRWDKVESPSIWVNTLQRLQSVVNSAYRQDAEESDDQSSKSTRSDKLCAISDNLLCDLVLAFLLESYATPLLLNVTSKSTLTDVKTSLQNLYDSRAGRETIAAAESARRTFSAPQPPASQPTQPNQRAQRTNTPSCGRGGRGGKHVGNSNRPTKISATRFTGWEKWAHGTFTDANGVVRFKIPEGMCFGCFKTGHYASACTEDRARSRISELQSVGIKVPLEDAMGLHVFDLNSGATHDEAARIAINAMLAQIDLDDPLFPEPTIPVGRVVFTDVDVTPRFYHISLADDDTAESSFRATPSTSPDFVLDSGASRHFTTERRFLRNYVAYPTPRKVGGAFGSGGKAIGEGDIVFNLDGRPVGFKGVMLVPELGVNLLSTTRMMMAGVVFSNTREKMTMLTEEGQVLMEVPVAPTMELAGSRVRPLSEPEPSPELAFQLDGADHASRWHRRSGHLSHERLKKLESCSKGLSGIKELGLLHSCDACERSKATRKAVANEAENPPTRRNKLIHSDTWGPSPVRGIRGDRYFNVVVDGFSRYMWGSSSPTKLAIPAAIVGRLKKVSQAAGNDLIVSFQSDNGGEFVNSTISPFLVERGISHRRIVPYTHSQNGFVERRFRSLLEVARSLLSDAKLPLSLWPYAVSSAVYLSNRSPTSSLPNSITPFESYFGHPPSLSNLRAWGCLAYLFLTPERSNGPNKLQDRGVKARFIGYPEDSKGWYFWVPSQRKIVVAWSARFVEDVFEDERSDEEMKKWDGWVEEFLEAREDQLEVEEQNREGSVKGRAPLHEEEEEEQHREGREEQPPTQNPPAPPSPSPPPQPTQPPPNPNPPAPSIEPRRYSRLQGGDAPYFQPLAGAPTLTDLPSSSADIALSTFLPPNAAARFVAGSRRKSSSNRSQAPSTKTLSFDLSLAFAVHDPSLDVDSSTSSYLTFEVAASSTRAELRAELERAFATSPAWNGSLDEPSFKQAMAGPDVEKWIDAMMAELAAFEATGTWEEDLVDLPEGRRAILVKWVLLVKRDADGRVIKYKARLVARGDMQVEGVDFDETFSSTVRLTTVRVVYALLASNPTWSYRQFDISNAYLLGNLEQEIYVKQPPGFTDSARPGAVRRLRRALYGLRQGGREWQKVLRTALESLGFRRSDADHGLYVRRKDGKFAVIPTHVDDGLVVGDDDLDAVVEELSEKLEGKLKQVDTGLFLSMRVRRLADGAVELDQSHYAKSVLERFFPEGLTARTTPLDSDYSSITPAAEDERYDCPYRELLGALVYLSSCTRPDLAFALSFASRFSACPAERHWSILVRISRFLSGNVSLGLRYSAAPSSFSADLLTAWTDSDHAGDRDTRRSVSGYVFGVGWDSLCSTAVSWMSRRQKSVAISSTEAEYVALSETAREALWLRALLLDLGYPPTLPTLIRGDNSGSLLLATHPTSHSRTKHISVHYHSTRELVDNGTLTLKWIPTDDMVAHFMTKGLGGAKHVLFSGRCGLRNLRREGGCEKGGMDAKKVDGDKDGR